MKTHTAARIFRPHLSLLRLVASAIWIQLAAVVVAQPVSTSEVRYNPTSKVIQKALPYSESYTLTVTSPNNMAQAATVTLQVSVNGALPEGVSSATALSYVSVTDPVTGEPVSELYFDSRGQSRSVRVTVDWPIDAAVGNYGYQIIALGWPNPQPGKNVGSSINATLTAAVLPPPPEIVINTPVDGSTITIQPGDLPLSVPYTYTATATGANPAPITSVTNALDGVGITPTSQTNLPALVVNGSGTLVVTSAGEHTVSASATNIGGTAETSSTFTVVIDASPPSVAIETPAPNAVYDYVYGSAPLDIPFVFKGTTPAGTTIRSLEARLNGQAIAFTQSGIFTVEATGQTRLDLAAAGVYTLWVKASNEYGSAETSQTFTINLIKVPLTVKADDKSKAYGAVNPSLTYTVTGFVNGETLATSDVTGTAALSTTAVQSSTPGTYPITAALGSLASNHYTFQFVDGTLTINKPVLTVTPAAVTKVYGAPVPTLQDYTITGFVNGDTAAVVSGAPALSTTATAASAPGSYPISAALGSLSAENYTFAFASNTLTVTKAPLTFTALNASRAYGAANPNFGYTVAGFVNGDTEATAFTGTPALTSTASATSSVAGSPYPITITAGTLSSSKYTFSFVPAQLSVTRAPLTVRADDKTKVQGAANPSLTYTVTGFVNGETTSVLSGTPALSTTANQNSPAGSYPITAAQGTLSAANYSFSFVDGTLTVTAPTTQTISGVVFFDVDGDGTRDTIDIGVPGFTVKLYKNNAFVQSAQTSNSGEYSFTVSPGTYSVDLIRAAGFSATTQDPRTVTISSSSASNVDFGLGLDFCAIRDLKGDGKSHGYWKTNIGKALDGKTSGVQESKANLLAYTATIADLFLSPYDGLTLSTAESILKGGDQLKLQLLASEYNLASGRLINDNLALTGAFIYWGEYIYENRSKVSSKTLEFAKDWFDAFNNSYGGKVSGPCGTWTPPTSPAPPTEPPPTEPPPPPTVEINTPAPDSIFTRVDDCPGVEIPFLFTGTSRSKGIKSLSAKLDGETLSVKVDDLGKLVAKGSGKMYVLKEGAHTLTVTATDDVGTVTASRTFHVLVIKPTLALTITKPEDQQVITRVAGSPATDVPFSFTATATHGVVCQLSATLNNSSVSFSSSGLNTISATGTGTLKISNAGTYVLKATGRTAAGLIATDTVTFIVKELQPAPQPEALGCGTAIVRHGVMLNGNSGIDGSIQVLLPESSTLNGQAWISKDFFVPGNPSLKLNGNPQVGAQINGSGSSSPSNYTVTLNGKALIGRFIRRTNAVDMPSVSAPPASPGNRSVTINKSSDKIGDFATVRDLTINGNVGKITMAPGTYRNVIFNGKNTLVIGVAGSSTPTVYNFQQLTMNGDSSVEVVGPVVITVGSSVVFNGTFGTSKHPDWVTLRIANHGLTLNGKAKFYGRVIAPKGHVILNGNDYLKGCLIADCLTLNGNSLVDLLD